MVPAYCLRELPGHSTGRRKGGWRRADALSCGDGVKSPGTLRQIEFARRRTRKGKAEQRELCKPAEGPQVLGKVLLSARV